MASRLRLRSLVVALVLLGLGVAWLEEPRPAEAAALPTWTGGVNLYRTGTFTTQKSWLWCTAAGVQIVRNIVDRKTRPHDGRSATLFRLDARRAIATTCRCPPASIAAGWTAGLRHFVDDRYRLVSSRTFDSRASIGRHPAAADQPAGRADRLPRQPRLDPDRLPADRRSGEDVVIHGHQRPGDRAALRPPEQERLRHGTEHEADDRPAQALLHALEVRPAADDLGRPLRLDPAGAGQGGGRRCDCGTVAGRQRCTERRRESGAGRARPARVRRRRRTRLRRQPSRCSPANVLLDRIADPVPATDASPAPLGAVMVAGLALVAITALFALRLRRRPA